jgi:hypothetical protein
MSKKKNRKAARRAPSGETPPRTLFICVRDRHGKGQSCAGSGSRSLLAQAKALLHQEQIPPEELSVRPVGCLGRCERGPICVAVVGDAAWERKPPKGKGRKAQPILVSIEVAPCELRATLREALLQPA